MLISSLNIIFISNDENGPGMHGPGMGPGMGGMHGPGMGPGMGHPGMNQHHHQPMGMHGPGMGPGMGHPGMGYGHY